MSSIIVWSNSHSIFRIICGNPILILSILGLNSLFLMSEARAVAGSPFVSLMYQQSRLCPDDNNDFGQPYRFHDQTKKCFLIGTQGPCGEMMTFTILNRDYGVCDCDQVLRCGRPLIYWPQTKRCYYVNDKGPCGTGKWLVFGFNLNPICRRNPCQNEIGLLPSRGSNFWFEYKGRCHRTGTQGYCSKPGEILLNEWKGYRPTCTVKDFPTCAPQGQTHVLRCLPGMKMDYDEKCMGSTQMGNPSTYTKSSSSPIPHVYPLRLE